MASSSSSVASRAAMLRLMAEYQQLQQDPLEGSSASPVSESNFFHWNASIFGPEGTPWEGGIFCLKMKFPDNYPEKPPVVQFTSYMYHPNVFNDGTLCLDIIQNNWSPVYTVGSILTSIQSLLNDPNPLSPANVDAANMYINDRTAYNKKVRKCAARSLEVAY